MHQNCWHWSFLITSSYVGTRFLFIAIRESSWKTFCCLKSLRGCTCFSRVCFAGSLKKESDETCLGLPEAINQRYWHATVLSRISPIKQAYFLVDYFKALICCFWKCQIIIFFNVLCFCIEIFIGWEAREPIWSWESNFIFEPLSANSQ